MAKTARIFRKSSTLHHIPTTSIAPDIFNKKIIDYNNSNYVLRQSKKSGKLATAEVAAKALKSIEKEQSAHTYNTALRYFLSL